MENVLWESMGRVWYDTPFIAVGPIQHYWFAYIQHFGTPLIPSALLVWAAKRYSSESGIPERAHRAEASPQMSSGEAGA